MKEIPECLIISINAHAQIDTSFEVVARLRLND